MNEVAQWLTAGCYLLALVLFVKLHFQNPQYSPVRHAVSDYGVGKSAGLFGLYNLLGSLGALGMAYLFWVCKDPIFPSKFVLFTLLMVSARLGLGLFKTDLEGQSMTTTGRLHYLFAILNFTFAYMVVSGATPLLTGSSVVGFFGSLLGLLKAVSAVSLVGVVVTVFKPLRFIFGIVERVFLLSVMLWFLCASLSLALH